MGRNWVVVIVIKKTDKKERAMTTTNIMVLTNWNESWFDFSLAKEYYFIEPAAM